MTWIKKYKRIIIFLAVVAKKYKRVLVFLAVVAMAIVGVLSVFGWKIVLVSLGIAAVIHRKDFVGTRFQDWINPLKWGSVLYASFMKLLFPMHIVEQLILRMYDMECRQCMVAGKCKHCKCDMSKVFTPWDVCSLGNWGPMYEDEEEYRELRREYPVEITVKYGREVEYEARMDVGPSLQHFWIPIATDRIPGIRTIDEYIQMGQLRKIKKT